MTITLAVRTQRRIKGKKYRPLLSTFLTADGPAKGTIWFDRQNPTLKPFTVKEVIEMDEDDSVVRYVDGGWDHLSEFFEVAKAGRYVLIGVTPHVHSHIEA